MADKELMDSSTSTPTGVSRRDIIKGVIAAGAVSSASYLFRAPNLWAQASAPGAVERLVTLTVNGQQRRVDVMKRDSFVRRSPHFSAESDPIRYSIVPKKFYF